MANKPPIISAACHGIGPKCMFKNLSKLAPFAGGPWYFPHKFHLYLIVITKVCRKLCFVWHFLRENTFLNCGLCWKEGWIRLEVENFFLLHFSLGIFRVTSSALCKGQKHSNSSWNVIQLHLLLSLLYLTTFLWFAFVLSCVVFGNIFVLIYLDR